MPIANISGPHLTVEKKRDLATRLTQTMSDVYGLPTSSIIVIIQENPPENVCVGGTLVCDRTSGA